MKEIYVIGNKFQNLTETQLMQIASEAKDIYYFIEDGAVYEIVYDVRKPALEAIVYLMLVDRLAHLNVVTTRKNRTLSDQELDEHLVLKRWYYQLFPKENEHVFVGTKKSFEIAFSEVKHNLIKQKVDALQSRITDLHDLQKHQLEVLKQYLQSLN